MPKHAAVHYARMRDTTIGKKMIKQQNLPKAGHKTNKSALPIRTYRFDELRLVRIGFSYGSYCPSDTLGL